MNNVIFTYNEESALSAGAGGFISENGAYIITISEAELRQNTDNKARWIEFSGEAEDGRKVQYLSIYSVKKDGTPNTFGENMINAMMGCAGINTLTQHMVSASKFIAPEFTGKRIGLVLQKVLRSKKDGSDTYGMEIRIPFIADTRQTLKERKDGVKPESVDKITASLKDRDNRNKGNEHQPTQEQQYYGGMDY
ncbi:DUF669 domain-containing protein [Salmonella enterica subsp. enterica serovar Uzaramo]|uniref:DUF669 domain-containing protein n=1 Tax=Salmonella enterica TaxID=28901 RepID=A0A760ACI4_SALER|nr:DUF669 domain-containing protein [Salmonella enterica subsp. enterica serovar Uzaramo]EHP5748849.1 DUF669 domain-containing protein [Salmonella enterica]EIM5531723.1 DUF669 domain-containing protein [Salmonella enterica subsp. enterica]ELD8107759.1 DUF669 domain-containing protein [Salmonella enterica subsp. enterica serovar Benin]EHP5913302.1 DUF669 domain-containing protein [Salmonella enterica]